MSISFKVLLPPSESKTQGGDFAPLQLDDLFLPELTALRKKALRAVQKASGRRDAAEVFRLGPKLLVELEHNQRLFEAPTMPALSRYSGVLYREIDTDAMTSEQWAYADQHLVIHSALFGPIRASDAIPNYRYNPQLVLPDLQSKQHWRGALGAALANSAEFFLDLRAKNYVALAPLAASTSAVFLEIVQQGPDGVIRALNHFNKQAKGQIVARLLVERPVLNTLQETFDWLQLGSSPLKMVSKHHWQFITG